jgi:hypothetical protein
VPACPSDKGGLEARRGEVDYWEYVAEGRGWTFGVIFIFRAQQYTRRDFVNANIVACGRGILISDFGGCMRSTHCDVILGINADLVPTF